MHDYCGSADDRLNADILPTALCGAGAVDTQPDIIRGVWLLLAAGLTFRCSGAAFCGSQELIKREFSLKLSADQTRRTLEC
jgi:hypothetical protein